MTQASRENVPHSSADGSRNPVRVIAVTSGKGGVGKTNVTVNLAAAFAQAGRKPMILDADLGLANVDVVLGIAPQFNLSDVISGRRTLDEIVVKGPGGIAVIPAASGVQSMAELGPAEHAGLIRAFSDLATETDLLLVDSAAGISDAVISFCRAAQEVLIVVCDEPASMTDAYALIKLLNREHGMRCFRIVANMVAGPGEGRKLFEKMINVADRFLDEVILDYVGSIPHDEYLRKAVKKQRTVVDSYPRSPSATAFRQLARQIETWPAPGAGKGELTFFIERLVQTEPGGEFRALL
jgi:flagellar biosynthesis protein FlhG